MIYLVLAVIILHALTLPIVVDAAVRIDSGNNDGKIVVKLFMIPIFVKRFGTETIVKKLQPSDEHESEDQDEQKSKPKGGGVKKFLMACAVAIAKRVRISDTDLELRLGTGDAAADAVTVGMLRIMYTQACVFFSYDGDSSKIAPDYNAQIVYFDFFGIFSISFANIIFAVCGVVVSVVASIGKRRNYANVAE